MKTLGEGNVLDGIHGVYWFTIGTLVVLLMATVFLPGRAEGEGATATDSGEEPAAAVPEQTAADAHGAR
ncbi:hypothetical protein [Streptomyces griseoloalbus]|uniref:Uncharacterized protein n=1 Tax=Streptomyces griseoloalbus TaxID=67303 RepID=A0A7W8BM86_9ACTN|nr:hypothetical protein [Streptomyces albaduncus]MBB5125457.1 hypothetical protein [Streptomyces albaduncus]GGW27597.1 hypothetical protein GCM10010340_01220 [Streptomyces albaduncus]